MTNFLSAGKYSIFKTKFNFYSRILINTSILIVLCLFIIPLIQIPIYYLSNSLWYVNYWTIIDWLGDISIFIIFLYVILNQINNRYYIKNVLKKYKFISILFLLYIWLLISCLLSNNYELAFYGSNYRHEGYFMFLNYFAFILLGIIISKHKITIKQKKCSIQKVIIILNSTISTFVSMMVILQYIFPKTDRIISTNLTGVFFHFNHCGYYLAISIICICSLIIFTSSNIKRISYSILFIINTSALIINETFGSYLAVFLSIIIMIILLKISNKKLSLKYFIPIILFLLTSTIMTLFGFGSIGDDIVSLVYDVKLIISKILKIASFKESKKENSNTGVARIVLWKIAIKYSLSHPLFGSGLEQIASFYKDFKLIQTKPANEYLYFLVSAGYPAFILYIAFLFNVVKNSLTKKAMNKMSIATLSIVLCYMISAFFGNSTFYITPYFMIFLSFTINNSNK